MEHNIDTHVFVVGLFLCFGGIAEAGTLEHGAIKPWWGDIIGVILLIIANFM